MEELKVIESLDQLTEGQKLELSDGKGKENVAGLLASLKASTRTAVLNKKTYSPLASLIVASPFYTAPRYYKITHIVIHHMAGNLSAKLCGQWFQNPSARCSSNYGIGSDGTIAGYVPEEFRAWTTGNWTIDHRAVTIEVADDGKNPWHTSDKALKATIKLCADICRRNGIKKLVYTGDKSGNLHMHQWYQNTDCPGAYLGGKFNYIAAEVNKILSGSATYTGKLPTRWTKARKYSLGDGYEKNKIYQNQIKRIQRFINWTGIAYLDVDGCYGPKTVAAVSKFQKKVGSLGTGGNWGKATQKKARVYKIS